MNIAVIVPFLGKRTYQAEYDRIVETIERNGHTVLSPEKPQIYSQALFRETQLHDTPRAHYEFIRKCIIDSDAVIVEASWEDFRVGHETTLALLYRKPVLALSQLLELGTYIHHPDFYGVKYTPPELPKLVETFLKKVAIQESVSTKPITPELPANSKTIVVFGGVYADIFNRVARIPQADEVTLSSDFKISLGGKATNAAVALARMGGTVFICGHVGHDTMGRDLEAVLIHEGIKTDFLHQDRHAGTGTVTLAVDERAKYSTIVHEAANVHITKEAVDSVFREIDAGNLQVDCIYLTLEPQKSIVEYIIRQAAKRQLFIFCDAAPHTRPLDAALLPLIDVIAPNQLEAQAMTGISVANKKAAQLAAARLLGQGAKQVIITLGNQGSYYQDGEHTRHNAAWPVRAIDEAGAGDAFRAAFVYELLHTKDLAQALQRATIAGAYAVTRFGSYDSMPTTAQLDAFITQFTAPKVSI